MIVISLGEEQGDEEKALEMGTMFLVDSVIVGAVGTVGKSTMEGGARIHRSDM
jgi:hypothetical protein